VSAICHISTATRKIATRVILIESFISFTFFACAKKVTKKAQPILMRDISSLDHSLGQNRRRQTNLIEHFKWNIMQDGMNCFCWAPDADCGNQLNYWKTFRWKNT